MKKNLVTIAMGCVALMMLAGCATTEERAARQAEQAMKVEAALNERCYKINVDRMDPLRGPSRMISYGYSVGETTLCSPICPTSAEPTACPTGAARH